MNALSYVRMVLWSFFGIRRRAAAGEELAQVKPLALVLVAIGMAALFGVGLFGLATFAVRSLAN